MEHFLTFIRKRLDRWIFPRENFQTTDSAKGNDFRRVIVSVKSKKQQKGKCIQKHLCMHFHGFYNLTLSETRVSRSLYLNFSFNLRDYDCQR